MILDTESWMNIRRFRALHGAGASHVEITHECGLTGARSVSIWRRTLVWHRRRAVALAASRY
jgi:hypothetical protein